MFQVYKVSGSGGCVLEMIGKHSYIDEQYLRNFYGDAAYDIDLLFEGTMDECNEFMDKMR